MSGTNWECPHCDRDQVVVTDSMQTIEHHIALREKVGDSFSLSGVFVKCANPECGKLTAILSIRPDSRPHVHSTWNVDYEVEPLYARRVIPDSSARPQPDYIPLALREDYQEACAIIQDSPKASATLARRCIQGMIRDFCNIRKGRLIDEIDALRQSLADGTALPGVSAETIEAIDHVRGIGNIGAHMEKDIDLIVPVDPGEAAALISLIEMLFDEWYKARHKRQARLAEIARIGEEKKQLIKDGRAGKSLPPPQE